MGRQGTDLTGRVFGRLTAKNSVHEDGKLLWQCDCICGSVVRVRPAKLVEGTTRSCGCLKKETSIESGKRRRLDLSGKRFGRLVAQTQAANKGKAVAWNCLCDCGNKTVVRTLGLCQGKTKSCGCLSREKAAKRFYKHGLSGDIRWSMYRHAKERAEKNGIPFTITFEDMPEIPKYCPVFPWIKLKSNTGNKTTAEGSPTLDRVIPVLGYTLGNIRIISHRANSLKSDASLEEARLIYEYMRNHTRNDNAN
jgi:hypothetical protein